MAPGASKLYSDDVSLVMVLLDTNPIFWAASEASCFGFSEFLSHFLAFLNSIVLINQMNQLVVIATGQNSCDYIYDSSELSANQSAGDGKIPAFSSELLRNLVGFMENDEGLSSQDTVDDVGSSLLSGSLSMALCYIQRVFRSGPLHPQPRILCLHGSPDGPEQYVAVMNSIFSAQRSMIRVDSCVIGSQHSPLLQQASYITGGVYLKPLMLDGLFQYLSVNLLYLQQTCTLAAFCNFPNQPVLISVPRVFVTKIQLIWDTYVLFVYPYSVSTTKSVQPADQFMGKPRQKLLLLVQRHRGSGIRQNPRPSCPKSRC